MNISSLLPSLPYGILATTEIDHAWPQLIFFEVEGEGKREEVGGNSADSAVSFSWLRRRRKKQIIDF